MYFKGDYINDKKYDLSNFSSKEQAELFLGQTYQNQKYHKEERELLSQKKSLLLYLIPSIVLLIIFWFLYKIIKEAKFKEKEDNDIINKIKK